MDVGLSTQTRNAEAEVVFRTDQEKLEFKQAKPKEIESYIENMAIEIDKRKSIYESRILGMRWILTWKTLKDETETR